MEWEHIEWEYKVISPQRDFRFSPDQDFERHLNFFGKEGWELVAVTGVRERDFRMFLKREKLEEETPVE